MEHLFWSVAPWFLDGPRRQVCLELAPITHVLMAARFGKTIGTRGLAACEKSSEC